jgi:hypothetical protein
VSAAKRSGPAGRSGWKSLWLPRGPGMLPPP